MGKIAKRKIKISSVKRANQKRTKLSKQGKLKMRRHKQKQTQKPVPQPKVPEEGEESDQGEDLMQMVEEDDLQFLRNAVSKKSYNLLKQIRFNETDMNGQTKRNKKIAVDNKVEDMYEENLAKMNEEGSNKRIRVLLPVKTAEGHIEKRVIEEEDVEANEEEEHVELQQNGINENAENSDMELETEHTHQLEDSEKEAISTVELLACREEVLKTKRFKIGVLSSGLLENPEIKSGNFKILLDFMDEKNPEVYLTIRKLATVSLLEVFKDLLPSYQIHQVNPAGVRLKKETFQLQNYEAVLLRSYKSYLQKLEKIANILRRKMGDTRKISEPVIQLGELAVKCMCDLLVTHPYFNYSTNISNFLVPLLDNRRSSVRETVANCVSTVFKEDKRGTASLTIVRKLNQHIKLKSHSVHTELLSVLLSLRMKDVNLDKEKEEDMKQKKLMSHKSRILALSKRERKRKKKLEQVEQEMLETKAEENKQSKLKELTDIMNIVFTIYFRILKKAPNSKVLSVCLEGLAKFAHCINLEYYQDLVSAIDNLMAEEEIGLKEQLHCIQCVFTILSGQGSLLNIDPHRFYVHLYKNLLSVHIGKTHAVSEILLKSLVQVLINRRKRITQARLIAFVKRINTLSLQLQYNATLGTLGITKQVIQLGKAANILLDTDNTTGTGFYQPEVEDPEYCNAHCTALWELVALQRHYHSTVKKMAKNIAWNVPTSGEGALTPDIAKLKPEELYTEYDPSTVSFNPAIPVPKKVKVKKTILKHCFVNSKFEESVSRVRDEELSMNEYIDFYKSIKK